MKKLLSLIFGLVVLLGGVLVEPVQASGPITGVPTSVREVLPTGTVRTNPYTVSKLVATNATSQVRRSTYSSIPVTMPDLKTKIVCEWLPCVDLDGIPYLTTGNNLYFARVQETRVFVQMDGRACGWDPILSLGSVNMTLDEGPYLIDDPINSNYGKNTVVWSYSKRIGGFLGIGAHTVTVRRYLRQIEGSLFEYYVLDSYPGTDFTVYSNYDSDSGFTGQEIVYASDSRATPVPVSVSSGVKTVLKSDLQGITYPVTIDPSTSFTGSASDQSMQVGCIGVWSDARSSANGNPNSGTSLYVSSGKHGYCSGGYVIERGYLYFDTSSLPDDATVTGVTLGLTSWSASSVDSTTLCVLSGMPTYPHDPTVVSDFYFGNYPTYCGQLSIGSFGTGYYTYMNLNSAASSSVSVTGTTKFNLVTGLDYSNVAPTGENHVTVAAYEYGSGYAPTLSVTYTVPVVIPSIASSSSSSITETSTTLQGYVTSDGGGSCSVNFGYGLTSNPSTFGWTTLQSGYYSSQYFSDILGGLSSGTLYYWEAKGVNTAGSGAGSVLSFLTLPNNPTSFAVTAGNVSNNLSWIIGTGASRTVIVYKTTGYPSSLTDGAVCYNSTGNSYSHTGLTNGITYYYSAWSYASGGGYIQYSRYSSGSAGTPYLLGPPVVNTSAASPVGLTDATLKGNLVSLTGYSSADC